jgi:phosphoenolpyruvate---glycerone phosphotransferase subunit DhaM
LSENVSLVIVSHSPDVARGTADMVRQMVGEEVKVAHCGGNPDGGLGTDVQKILRAIDEAWSVRGVAILYDIGGAETNSVMAIELLPEDRREKVVLCDAPIVEGAILAATEAAGGASLSEVRRRAGSESRDRMVAVAVAEPHSGGAAPSGATGSVRLRHEAGMHARPAVKLTKLAKRFSSKIWMADSAEGPWIDAKSINRVMGAKTPKNTLLLFRAEGEDARAAVESLVALVEQDFPDDR